MPTALVCLTFDQDNASLMIARGQMSPTPISRGDFGIVAVPRILSLLAAHGAPSTWFIPGHTIESYPSCVERVRAAGCEIGHHGWTHRPPSTMSAQEEEDELLRGVATIVRLIGARPAGYRSPSWDLSPHSVELLLKHGFTYDSSMMGHDYLPYQVRLGDEVSLQAPLAFGEDSRLVEMPVSWSLDDFPHFEYSVSERGILPGLMETTAVERNWIEDFLYMRDNQDWGVMTLTFHPHVIGRGHRMRMLERLLQRLLREGAKFVTLSQAVAEYRSRFPQELSLRS